MKVKFTPLHLEILLWAHVSGTASTLPYDAATATAKEYTQDLITQGLVYRECGLVRTTAYGEVKLQELLLTLNLPGDRN